MRRAVVVLLASLALVLPAVPAAAQEPIVTVTFAGPVIEGTTLELTCPEGYRVIYDPGGPRSTATFYRSPAGPYGKPLTNPFGPGGGVNVVYWQVPEGARYAEATLTCELHPIFVDYSGRLEAGQSLTVVCPPSHPYLQAASPTTFQGDVTGFTQLNQELVYDAQGFRVGITFTAPADEDGSYHGYLQCGVRPLE